MARNSKKSEFVSGAGTAFEIIQKLSGAVADLGGSDDDLRRLLSDKKLRSEVAKLLIGNSGLSTRTLIDMLAAGKYDWVNPDITQKNFPVDPARFTTEGCKVFHFNKVMTTAKIEAAIRKEGYEPANLEHLLAYGAENSEEQRKYPIVGLGSSWVRPHGNRGVPFLYVGGRERLVDVSWGGPAGRWSENYRFLASRK